MVCGGMAKVVLYSYWRSSCSYRVRIALAHKGIAYDTVPVNLLEGKQSSPEHEERSATRRVPCLAIGDKLMIESVAIIELLEALHPQPALFPADPWSCAYVRSLVEIVNAGTQPLQNLDMLASVEGLGGDRKAWGKQVIERGLSAFERQLDHIASQGPGGSFSFGDELTAADAFLVPQVYNARRFGVNVDAFPRVARAASAAEETPACRAAHPDAQPDAVR